MNKLMKKAAALLTAGLMATASLGAEAFAESGSAAKSSAVAVAYGADVAKPTYTIKGEKGYRLVKFTTATTNATIYYTTNGTTPTTSSKVYKTNTLLKIYKDTKFKAIAVYGSSVSPVMTKTVKVTTVYGDVTGDGNVNQNDYNRLYNSFIDKSKYVCTDNADCNANGSVNSTDLTILQMYLAGTIKKLPYTGSLVEEEDSEEPEALNNSGNTSTSSGSSTTTSVKLGKPGINVYKSLGGKKIEFVSSTSGVTFYYTTNGTTPTTSSTRYTDKFLISKAGSTVVKVIAYKNGSVSAVQQTTVTVGTTGAITSSASTSTEYSGSLTTTLSCGTSDATIFYTTDGSDPATSSTAKTYYSAVTLMPTGTSTKVVLRAYARSKANADSTATFEYKFTPDFTLSGTVWDDTPTSSTTANGVRASNEAGISGITVRAYNTLTNAYVKETTTDSAGNYVLNGLIKGNTYKVVFEFNDQKYRPYTSIVTGGNQALLNTTVPQMIIKNGGAFTSANVRLTDTNNYSQATNDSYFRATATTSGEYSESTANIGLALNTNVYGAVSLSIATATAAGSTSTVKNNEKVTYTLTITNNSPYATLSDAVIGFYTSDAFANVLFTSSTGYTINGTVDGVRNGYRCYTISNLLDFTGSIAPGRSVSLTFNGYVNSTLGTKLYCCAEIQNYRYNESVYDLYSVPGNMNIGTKRENDEAVASVLEVSNTTVSNIASNAGVYTNTRSYTIGQGEVCEFDVLVTGVTSANQCAVLPGITPLTLATWDLTETKLDDGYLLHFKVNANASNIQGICTFTVYIYNHSDINATVSVTITR